MNRFEARGPEPDLRFDHSGEQEPCSRAAAIAASVVLFVFGLADGGSAQAEDSTAFHADSTVTLAQARALTVQGHPALASDRALVEAAQKRRSDAGRRPNPVLSGEVENFGNSSEENRLEITVQLGQTFELGGDRKASFPARDPTAAIGQSAGRPTSGGGSKGSSMQP